MLTAYTPAWLVFSSIFSIASWFLTTALTRSQARKSIGGRQEKLYRRRTEKLAGIIIIWRISHLNWLGRVSYMQGKGDILWLKPPPPKICIQVIIIMRVLRSPQNPSEYTSIKLFPRQLYSNRVLKKHFDLNHPVQSSWIRSFISLLLSILCDTLQLAYGF